MSTKSILFQGVITASGIVNFDHTDGKWLLKKAKRDSVSQLSHNNVKIAKHAYKEKGIDKDGNQVLEAVLKISKDCLRNGIFFKDQPFHNTAIVYSDAVFCKHIASKAGILRGYMYTDVSLKKKSPVYISDAKQTSNNVSSIDIGSLNSPKDQKVDTNSDSGITMHFKETISGLTTYEFYGAIDVTELQFISLSQIYDRMAVDPNHLDLYIKELETTLGSEVSPKAFYIKKGVTNGLPEEGILLTQKQVMVLIEGFFERLLNLEITRGANGRAWLTSLDITPRNGGLDYEKHGTTITDVSDIAKIIDNIEITYDKYSEKDALYLYKKFETGKKEKAEIKTAKKSDSKK